ncbi:20774_t:CDS:2, partial [Gigaspora margarita]
LQGLTEIEEMLITQVFTIVSVYNLRGGQYAYHRSAFRDFQVCQDKVSRSLKWLKENNIFYHDIEIADDILRLLPENDTIVNQLSEASNSQELYNEQANDLDTNENDDVDYISRTFVPVLPPGS